MDFVDDNIEYKFVIEKVARIINRISIKAEKIAHL